MALYLVRARYSPSAFQGMLAAPSDRGEAAKALFKALGIKTHEILFSISNFIAAVLLPEIELASTKSPSLSI